MRFFNPYSKTLDEACTEIVMDVDTFFILLLLLSLLSLWVRLQQRELLASEQAHPKGISHLAWPSCGFGWNQTGPKIPHSASRHHFWTLKKLELVMHRRGATHTFYLPRTAMLSA